MVSLTHAENQRAALLEGPEVDSALQEIQQHEAHDLYMDGVAAALKGKRAAAERLLLAAVTLDPQRHQAWLWLGGVVESPERSIEYLQRVLELVPDEPHALEGLEWARRKLSRAAAPPKDSAQPATDQPRMLPEGVRVQPVVEPPVTVPNTGKRSRRLFALAALGGLIGLLLAALACLWSISHYVNVLVPPNFWSLSEQATASPKSEDTPFLFIASITPTVPVSVVAFTEERPSSPTLVPTIPAVALATSPLAVTPTISLTTVVPVTPAVAKLVVSRPPSPVAKSTLALAAPPSPTPPGSPSVAFRPPWFPSFWPMGALRPTDWRVPTTLWDEKVQRSGKWIDIDLSEQVLRAFEDGELVLETAVSTGTKRTPTVKGEYRILSKYRAFDMVGADYYLPGVPYTMFFHGDYAIHGANWHNKFGQPMSHGCVNMRPEDAKRLFNWADPKLPKGSQSIKAKANTAGTLVVIHD